MEPIPDSGSTAKCFALHDALIYLGGEELFLKDVPSVFTQVSQEHTSVLLEHLTQILPEFSHLCPAHMQV